MPDGLGVRLIVAEKRSCTAAAAALRVTPWRWAGGRRRRGGRAHRMDNGDLAVEAALAGMGLACSLEGRVQRDLDEGRLVRVLEPHCPSFAGFHLYYPSRAQLAPKLKALFDFYRVRARKT